MKTCQGMRLELYAGKKTTRDFFRNNEKAMAFLNGDNEGKSLVIHSKLLGETKYGFDENLDVTETRVIWHFDYIVKGKSHRKPKVDLSLMEELQTLREMESVNEILNSVGNIDYDYEYSKAVVREIENRMITQEMATLWGIE